MEDHQRQNVDADILGGEEQERHRQAADLTLLRTAEQEHDAIGPIEPEHPAQADEDAEHEGQQDRGQGDDLEQIHRRNDRPQSLRDAGAECGIDDEQDRPLIDDGHEDAVLGQPGADVPVQQLPSSAAASRGVTITPRTFDTDAELTARATLPRATDVNAIEDCTVEGSRQRKRKPVAMTGLMMAVGRSVMSKPIAGKSTKVPMSTRSWNGHRRKPASV